MGLLEAFREWLGGEPVDIGRLRTPDGRPLSADVLALLAARDGAGVRDAVGAVAAGHEHETPEPEPTPDPVPPVEPEPPVEPMPPVEPTPPPPDTSTGDRPTGTGYVAYESLWRTGRTLRDVLELVGGRVLTFPDGEFTWADFPHGYIDGIRCGNAGYPVKGLIGSGVGRTILRPVRNSNSQVEKIRAETAKIGTNPTNLIHFNAVPGAVVAGLSLIGTEQNGAEYNGIRLQGCPDAVVEHVLLRGANPGSKNAPPGETFGLNVHKSARVKLRDSEFDGRDEAGNRVCASPFGWNSTSDADVRRVNTHHALAGMPTWWQTENIYVEDVVSFSNGSGGGGLSGQGFNLERASGRIRFVRCTSKPWGKWERTKGNADATANSGLHWSMNNDQVDMPDVQIIDPIHDRGPHSSGALAIYRGIPYASGQKVTSMPKVIKGGRELLGRESGNVGGVTADTHFVIYT